MCCICRVSAPLIEGLPSNPVLIISIKKSGLKNVITNITRCDLMAHNT